MCDIHMLTQCEVYTNGKQSSSLHSSAHRQHSTIVTLMPRCLQDAAASPRSSQAASLPSPPQGRPAQPRLLHCDLRPPVHALAARCHCGAASSTRLSRSSLDRLDGSPHTHGMTHDLCPDLATLSSRLADPRMVYADHYPRSPANRAPGTLKCPTLSAPYVRER